ncbi:sensor domain-containing diguanylate cyclase [Neptunomonas sp. XY-337]|uniref:GGDEF domain-containing protein n=1 Tax=Neptunomonas sp. XY-337 TaxID=2561897 RepID=UPI0010A9EE58|nr:sensor domain-containing diguanylate cyclase [Neptunomonas sp. XY-337]
MLRSRDPKSAKLAIIIWAIAVNALLFFFVAKLFFGIQVIDETWRGLATKNINHATKLAEIERNMGYVGFIHHFKNYVIRGTDLYYQQAEESYQQTSLLLQTFQAQAQDPEDIAHTKLIQSTLDDYYAKLHVVRENYDQLATQALDSTVRVDDSSAQLSLIMLREKLLPQLEQSASITDELVTQHKTNTVAAALVLLPTFILSSIFSVRLINTITHLKTEYATIFNMSPDGILFIDESGHILRANQAAADMFEYSRSELRTLRVEDLMEGSMRENHCHYRHNFSQREQTRHMSSRSPAMRGQTKSGCIIELNIAISTRQINNQMHCVCILRDLTEQNELKDLAERDHLTSVYNRRSLEAIVAKEFERSNRMKAPLSLMLIDIDNFKQINDSLGHQQGDEAIKIVAHHLLEHTRAYDHIGRWGGDEFLILCPELGRDDSLSFAKRLQDRVRQLDTFHGHRLSLSIGIATRQSDERIPYKQLLQAADKALYQAKAAGRDHAFHADTQPRAHSELVDIS